MKRLPLVLFLLLIIGNTAADLVIDRANQVSGWHIALDLFAALSSVAGLILLFLAKLRSERAIVGLKASLQVAQASIQSRDAALAESSRTLQKAIQEEFDRWSLTQGEREIALLLIKGLSLEEIAGVRGSKESTVRQQAAALYAKAGLKGRRELAAYFIEELLALPPPEAVALRAPDRH